MGTEVKPPVAILIIYFGFATVFCGWLHLIRPMPALAWFFSYVAAGICATNAIINYIEDKCPIDTW